MIFGYGDQRATGFVNTLRTASRRTGPSRDSDDARMERVSAQRMPTRRLVIDRNDYLERAGIGLRSERIEAVTHRCYPGIGYDDHG